MRQLVKVEPDGTDVHWFLQTTAHTPTAARAAGNRYQERMWFLVDIDNLDEFEVEYTCFPIAPAVASLASAEHIGGLTKPRTPKQMAKAFLRWRSDSTASTLSE